VESSRLSIVNDLFRKIAELIIFDSDFEKLKIEIRISSRRPVRPPWI